MRMGADEKAKRMREGSQSMERAGPKQAKARLHTASNRTNPIAAEFTVSGPRIPARAAKQTDVDDVSINLTKSANKSGEFATSVGINKNPSHKIETKFAITNTITPVNIPITLLRSPAALLCI